MTTLAPTSAQEIIDFDLRLVIASLTNPRTTFDPAYLNELANTIKPPGRVLQPILLRPLPASRLEETAHLRPRPTHEIVYGECRYRGSKIAQVKTIRATVEDLTDAQVRVIQLIENLKRKDLTELEEAAGYRRLIEESDMSADLIADKIDKSRAYVYARLKLLDLCAEGHQALRDGTIDASRGLLLARIPDTKLQIKALGEIVKGFGYQVVPEPLSVRQAKEHIQKNYMVKLDSAKFDITSIDLLPTAGSCKTCAKRTGHDPDLFAEVKNADVCTDPTCFHAKEEARGAAMVRDAKAKGHTVIAGKAVSKEAKQFVAEKAKKAAEKQKAQFEQGWRDELLIRTWQTIADPRYWGDNAATPDLCRYLCRKAAAELSSDATEALCKLLDLGKVAPYQALMDYIRDHASPDQVLALLTMHKDSSADDHDWTGHVGNEGLLIVAAAAFGHGSVPSLIESIKTDIKNRMLEEADSKSAKSPLPLAPAAQAKGVRGAGQKGKGDKAPAAPGGDAPLRKRKMTAADAQAAIAAAMQDQDTDSGADAQGNVVDSSQPVAADVADAPSTSLAVDARVAITSDTTWLPLTQHKFCGKVGTITQQIDGEDRWMVTFKGRSGGMCVFDGADLRLADAPPHLGSHIDGPDPLYDQAVTIVKKNNKASISLVQRLLSIGYNRAARLLEDMERAGLLGSMGANGHREILEVVSHG